MQQNVQSIRIRADEVAAILGIGKSTVWALTKKDPHFPQPQRMGARFTYWLRNEVEAYAVGKPVTGNGDKAECRQ